MSNLDYTQIMLNVLQSNEGKHKHAVLAGVVRGIIDSTMTDSEKIVEIKRAYQAIDEVIENER